MSGSQAPGTSDKKKLIFKFEYDGQQYELSSLTTADTVADLRAVVCSMLNIENYEKINLKSLQPTKLIDAADDMKLLSDIFSQTRERIIVEDVHSFGDESTSQVHPPSSSSSGQPSVKHHKSETSDELSSARASSRFNELLAASQQSDLLQPTSPSNEDSPARQRKLPRDQQADLPVCSSTGYFLRNPVPSNNSCLFISVHFCLTHGIVDDKIGKSMRKIIADTVASDKEHYDDAFLGKSNAEYCRWILDDNNWGGAIELSILCKYYETEIVAIDVKNTILNRFGEDSQYPKRMLLLYDGIHYDPLMFQPLDDNYPIQTLFATDNLEVLNLALELAKEAKQSHQFTDLKTLTMRCETCNTDLDANTASEHAAKTGHTRFVEKQ